MTDIVIRGASIWDGSGRAPFVGDVLIRGNRIRGVGQGQGRPDGAELIDGSGLTLMPGLVEGHAHPTFIGATRNTDMGDIPPEEHLLATMHNARILLDHGFTSAYSAASARLRLDVVIRNEIDAGRIPGPRLKAAGPEITVTGGLGDEDRAHQQRSSFALVADGPDAITQAVRRCAREGVDTIKINISGDDFVPHAPGARTVMTDAECHAAVEAARAFGKRVACHARAGAAIAQALRAGVDIIYHCEMADPELLDQIEARKDRLFVGPAIGLIYNTLHEAEPYGISHEAAVRLGMQRVLDESCRTYAEMRRRGIRVVIGGDYGFAWTPQGSNARDIEHFVKLFGYSPGEALQCATRIGGELMGMDLGLVREGYLADLLLVDGDPLTDVSILQHAERLVMIMKDGRCHKRPPADRWRQVVAA